MGETYDARMELPGWSEPGYAGGGWARGRQGVGVGPLSRDIFGHDGRSGGGTGIRGAGAIAGLPGTADPDYRSMPARELTEPEPGVFIFDLGQNFAGVMRLRVKGPRGTRVQISVRRDAASGRATDDREPAAGAGDGLLHPARRCGRETSGRRASRITGFSMSS